MKAKALHQIEGMKAQTIGVEIEMNNISRQEAAKIAAGYFGTNQYDDTNHRHGYHTWSAWDAQGREWMFQRDVSISGPDAQKCEMVTPILCYDDIPLLQEVVRQLRHAGAKSNPRRGCGVHIHIGLGKHTPQTIRNLTNIMAAHEDLLVDAITIDRGRMSQYCRTVDAQFLDQINKKKPSTMDDLEDVWYTSQGCDRMRTAHYNPSRYHMLNLHATFTKGTIEFRLFQFNNPGRNFKGGLHAGQLKAYIQLCLAMSQMALDSQKASPKKPQVDNQKFAMRTWLVRMGMVGDEFKTARDLLTRRLYGNSAWRYGAAA